MIHSDLVPVLRTLTQAVISQSSITDVSPCQAATPCPEPFLTFSAPSPLLPSPSISLPSSAGQSLPCSVSLQPLLRADTPRSCAWAGAWSEPLGGKTANMHAALHWPFKLFRETEYIQAVTPRTFPFPNPECSTRNLGETSAAPDVVKTWRGMFFFIVDKIQIYMGQKEAPTPNARRGIAPVKYMHP